MQQVYSNIKAIRLEKGLTQEDMASHLKMTQSNYGRLEKGLSQFTIERLEEVARFFEMSVNALLSYDGKTDFKENAEYYYNELQKSHKEVVKLKKQLLEKENEIDEDFSSKLNEREKFKTKSKELSDKIKLLELKVQEQETNIVQKQKEIDYLRDSNQKLIDKIPNSNTPV